MPWLKGQFCSFSLSWKLFPACPTHACFTGLGWVNLIFSFSRSLLSKVPCSLSHQKNFRFTMSFSYPSCCCDCCKKKKKQGIHSLLVTWSDFWLPFTNLFVFVQSPELQVFWFICFCQKFIADICGRIIILGSYSILEAETLSGSFKVDNYLLLQRQTAFTWNWAKA